MAEINNLIPFVCLLLIGCASSSLPPESLQPNSLLAESTVVELRISRGSLTENNFEQYNLSGSDLFVECGIIRRGRPNPGNQHFGNLDESVYAELQSSISDILALEERKLSDLPPPGTGKGFADPGTLDLKIVSGASKTTLVTSFDYISDRSPGLHAKLRQLVETLRTTAKDTWGLEALCGNERFYGITSQ